MALRSFSSLARAALEATRRTAGTADADIFRTAVAMKTVGEWLSFDLMSPLVMVVIRESFAREVQNYSTALLGPRGLRVT